MPRAEVESCAFSGCTSNKEGQCEKTSVSIGVDPRNKGCGCLDFNQNFDKLRSELKNRFAKKEKAST